MNERLSQIVRHPATIPTVIGAIAFGSGVGLGYILGRRTVEVEEVVVNPENPDQLVIDFNKGEIMDYIRERGRIVIDEEVHDADYVHEFNTINEELSTDSGPVIVEQLAHEEEVEPVHHSIFADSENDWDYNEELAKRSELEPYVLHKDEFYSEEGGYVQTTITYYELDEEVCDQEDQPVYNYKEIIGEFKFGHGSGDPNVFYVRNDIRRAEYEVLRHTGSYAEEVLGIETEAAFEQNELRHSKIQKLRPE